MSATVLKFPTERCKSKFEDREESIARTADDIASNVLAQVYQDQGYFEAMECSSSVVKLVSAVEELTRHQSTKDTGRVVDMVNTRQLELF